MNRTSSPRADAAPPASGQPDRTLFQHILALILRPIAALLLRTRYESASEIPRSGPVVLVSNHITEIDPVVIALATWHFKRGPHFMAKASLFRIPVIGAVLRRSGQIPVDRAGGGTQALARSREYLDRGNAVLVYPEATLTRDPDLWPMRGKTGAVRLVWGTSIPVIPVVHWGTQHLLGRYSSRLNWLPPRTRVVVRVGAPIDLSEFTSQPETPERLEAASAAVMAAITHELEQLRGPKPTPGLWSDMSVPKSKLSPVEAAWVAKERG